MILLIIVAAITFHGIWLVWELIDLYSDNSR